MERKFKYSRTKDYRSFQLPNGKLVDVYFSLYSCKVNLEKGTYIPETDEDFATSSLPLMQELVNKGIVIEVSCVKTYDINFPSNVSELNDKDFEKIRTEFKENGFNVSIGALKHNYNCWLGDFKSGYRGRGYHLFTPCGCNPLSFRATTLHKKCKDWQETYFG